MAFCSSQQRLRTADLVEQAVAAQFVGDGDRVDRLAGGHQPADRRVDVLVAWLVEVIDHHPELGDLADHVARQQQRTEQALFGVEVVRWHTTVGSALYSGSRPMSRANSLMR